MRDYYEQRAPEYDDWYLGTGLFADRFRPGWNDELWEVQRLLAELSPAKTLDVACGTGFLTRFLRGDISCLDQSQSMIELASVRVPGARFFCGDAMNLPFDDDSFDRVLAGHFYGHLNVLERDRFLQECSRVARELVVVDSALRKGVQAEEHQKRMLSDGSTHTVYKRFFSEETLLSEIGGEASFFGAWFVMARTDLQSATRRITKT